jgi:predicted signal transduction protein with EAL and GGDEF domain
MLFTDIPSKAELYGIIDEIINNSSNINFEGYVFYIAMNAGIAFYPDHGRDIDSLIKKAETANYCAKKTGKDFYVYSKELKNDIIKQVQMVNMLQRGIEKEEFTLFYQPLFNLNNNEIIGAEALVRWPHPVKGYISPEVFIPAAEKSKQIYELERWIINTALQQKEQWEREGLDHLELSINLSSKTLRVQVIFKK